MNQQLDQFIRLLEQTESLYRSLLPIIDEEKSAAVASDIDRLAAAGFEKESVLDQIRRADRDLNGFARHLAAGYGVPLKELNLSLLATKSPSPYDRKLQALADRLGDVVQKVQTANEEYRTLIKHCMRLVQNALGYFRHWMGGSDIYGARGDIRNDNVRGRHFVSGMV